MDNQIHNPIVVPQHSHKKSILIVVSLLLVLSIISGIYYFYNKNKTKSIKGPVTPEEKLQMLKDLYVEAPAGAVELTEQEKTQILQSLIVKPKPVKGTKTLKP